MAAELTQPSARPPPSSASDAREPTGRLAAPAPGRQRRWHSSEIFGKDHEVEIEHGHAVYRLRLTALGKLILTK